RSRHRGRRAERHPRRAVGGLPRRRSMKARKTASLATLVVLTGAMASASAPASGDAIRTDTSLGGYSIKTSAAPFRVLLDDPTLAVPHEPGTPVLEADPAYTA